MGLWLFLLALAAAGGTIAVATSGLFGAQARMRRLMREIPRTPIHEVREGQTVKIVGKLRFLGEPLHGPLSGRRCGYYEFKMVKHHVRDDEEVMLTDEQRRDFILQDASGRAFVRIEGALVFATRDRSQRVGLWDLPTEAEKALLERYQLTLRRGVFSKIGYHEAILDGEEDIAVGGVARWEPDPEGESGGYREPPRRLVLQATRNVPLFITDDPEAMG